MLLLGWWGYCCCCWGGGGCCCWGGGGCCCCCWGGGVAVAVAGVVAGGVVVGGVAHLDPPGYGVALLKMLQLTLGTHFCMLDDRALVRVNTQGCASLLPLVGHLVDVG